MIAIGLALLIFKVPVGPPASSTGYTVSLELALWLQSGGDHPHWDRLGDGVVDIGDLVWFRDTYFEEVTSAAGIQATLHMVSDFFASGQAWSDLDNDGWVDLYLTDSQGPNSCYRNLGNGTFAPVFTETTALPQIGSSGAVFADFDNDGWRDLYVLNNGPNTLFRNMGGKGFEDVTTTAGVGDSGKGASGSWADFDNDGFLDLYVVNWGEPGTFEDKFYKNNGDGTFTDITAVLGPRTHGAGFVASFLDFDNDADLDIYLVEDKQLGNVLWRNDGPGCAPWCFSEISTLAGAGTQVFGMGLAIGDYDGDLDLDLYFSNIGPMYLLQNQTSQGSHEFLSVGAEAGVAFDTIGWGSVFLDYDNDSWPDLYLAASVDDISQVNRLYRNKGDGTFQDLTYKSGAGNQGLSLGVAAADYDRDGRVDLIVGNMGSGYALYRNKTVGGHMLNVRLTGGGPVNRDAIGARAYLTLDNGRILMSEVKCGSSLGAGNDLALHFGLGLATPTQLRVVWPDGLEQTIQNPGQDQFLTIIYPEP